MPSKPDPQETGIHSGGAPAGPCAGDGSRGSPRYEALADQMETHNNRDVAVLFRKLAEIEKLHVDNVNDISEGHPAPHRTKGIFWEAPESRRRRRCRRKAC